MGSTFQVDRLLSLIMPWINRRTVSVFTWMI